MVTGHVTPQIRFNPRVLAGGRDYNLIWNEWFRDVSIHASSREDATGSSFL